MSNRLTYTIAGFLLLFTFLVAFFSILEDSFITDEPPHIVAGYSYLTKKDYRLNPEHPPLLKDLAAFPLLFLKLNFPESDPAWLQEDGPYWWHQFNLGGKFLFHSGNNPDKILIFSRLPMILLLILCGFYIFKISKEFFGNKVALLALFFFSFSPTFLAHGRFVTTDVGAAFGVVFSTYYFLKSLKNSKKRNLILAGISFGVAELLKFSLILLVPLFIFLALIYWLFVSKNLKEILKVLFFTFLIGLLIIWIVYLFHTWNYPPERQLRDTKFTLASHAGGPSSIKETCLSPTSFQKISRCPAEIIIWGSNKPVLKALSHYGLGLLMVFQRATSGHTTYFLGEISAAGWRMYFPFVYLIKEPLAFHILTILALAYFSLKIKEPLWRKPFLRFKNFIKEHFIEFSMLTWVLVYWITSIRSNLNIGVRHLLPAFPFTMILTANGIIFWLENFKFKKLAFSLITILLLWQIFSVIKIYPHFLSYANEIVGPENLYIYTVDSNLDWGQDLKRLKKWVDENEIEKIYIDYFGGADVEYYFGKKYLRWWGTRDPNEFEKPNYFAISASFLQGGKGLPAKGFDQPTGYYLWLEKYKPIARIGYSIFVYYIN